MFVRMKIGRYAGEIVDIQADAAHRLLAQGSAEDPYAPCEPAVEEREFSREEICKIFEVPPELVQQPKFQKTDKKSKKGGRR